MLIQGHHSPVAGQGTGRPGAGWGSGSALDGLSPWCLQYPPPFHNLRWLKKLGGSAWLLVSMWKDYLRRQEWGSVKDRKDELILNYWSYSYNSCPNFFLTEEPKENDRERKVPTWIPKMPTLVPWLLSWAQLGTGACGSHRVPHESSLLEPGQMLVMQLFNTWPAPRPLSPPSVILELKWQVFCSKQSVLLLPVPWPVPGCKSGDRRLRNQGLFQPHSRISLAMQTSEGSFAQFTWKI